MSVNLTPTQHKVVFHDDGALLVVAGPGSGKTRVLTERIRRLLAVTEERYKVLALTFTNKAANEMRERLSDVEEISDRAFIGTMHSFCVEVLANRGKSVGVDGLPHIFENYDDRKQILREAALKDSEASSALAKAPDGRSQATLLDGWLRAISEKKNALTLSAMVEDPDLRHIYELYDAALRACGAVDFDDLLLLTYRLFEERPSIASFYRRQFRYICVDEAQDLNEAQYRVLCALCGKEYFNIMMVGDPKQAIFTWNGAHPKYLDLFADDFKAERIELRENFRSSRGVISAAHSISPEYIATDVFPIQGVVDVIRCENEQAEATFVADKIMSLVNEGHPDVEGSISFERCAVLGRNRFVFTKLIETFQERQIDFYKKLAANNVESGSELVSQFELALRVLANPLDRLHVALLAKNWSVASTADEVYAGRSLRDLTGMDVLQILFEKAEGQNPSIISEAIRAIEWTPTDFHLVRGLDRLEEGARQFDEEPRLRVLQDITEWKKHWNYFVRSEQGGSHGVSTFLSQITLGSTQQPKQAGVGLLTVHSAKGMEFDIVFVIGMNEGTFPDYRAKGAAIDEEKRNVFVAVTRSRRLLYFTYPEFKMMPWGEEKRQSPSRFLKLIQGNV